jgi:aromatic-L-amino-acid/L-tryptophan decarboxylase
MEALLLQPAREMGEGFPAVLAQFDEVVAAHACRINHPRFLAFIPAAPCVASTLGDWLCAAANFFAGVWLEASGPTEVELVVLDWFRQWLNLPAGTQGILTSGGSEANLTALVVAREQLPQDSRPHAVLYVSEQRHWSIDRAARIMGLRPEQVRPVPVESDFRLAPAALAEAISRDRAAGLKPWAVVANAGATNTGTVDPLDPLADLCRKEGIWLHVDAAYGWSAVLIDEGRVDLQGIERANSLTLDPHKWLAQTYEVGCVLIRDGRLLARTFGMSPDYMQDVQAQEDEVNFADRGLALTRRFRALKIWLSIRALGLGWFRQLVQRGYDLARLAEGLLRKHAEFEILSPRRLSILCFRYVPPNRQGIGSERELLIDHWNLALIDAVRATGRVFLSSTRLQSRVALRLCFVNWRTTTADVEEVIDLLLQIGSQLAPKGPFVT